MHTLMTKLFELTIKHLTQSNPDVPKEEEKSPEQAQIDDFNAQLKKIETIFSTFFDIFRMASMSRSNVNMYSYHHNHIEQFIEDYKVSYNYLYQSNLRLNAHDFLMFGHEPSIQKRDKAIQSFYHGRHLGGYSNPYSLAELCNVNDVSSYVNDEPNLFIPYLFSFLSFTRDFMAIDDYQPFVLDALMQNKDMLSLVARLIQLSEDDEVLSLFSNINKETNEKVELMFTPFKSYVEDIHESVAEYQAHQKHLEQMEAMRKEIELQQKLDYYTKDSLSIDRTKASESIQDLLERTEQYINHTINDERSD